MRAKIIEKLITINEISSAIQKIFKSQFKISKRSIIADDSLLIIGLGEKDLISVVHCSINKNFKRTYISILLFKTQSLAEEFNIQQNSPNFLNQIEEKLISLLKDGSKYNSLYPFTELSKYQLEKAQEKRKIFRLETKILNGLIKHLYQSIDFSDEVMQFPFSLIQTDGKWEEWDEIYFPYIELIENKIIKTDVENRKVYRNYNFAFESDSFQRLIDLSIITRIKTNSEIKNQVTEEVNPYDYEIMFIFCNRTAKPFRYMNLLKFVNEIKSFSEKFKINKKNKCNNIKSQLILISQFGYDLEIKNYLRTHLIRETDYTIPIIMVPPIDNKVWHNFIENADSKPQKQNDLANIIRIGNNKQVSPSYRNNMVKSAKSQYSEIIERNKLVKLETDYLSKWHDILDVSKSTEILKSVT